MATRKRIPRSIETAVLTESLRRCCICASLTSDYAIKKGQIAHLDRDAGNNSEENLAFLCMPHHDQYDSRTSQAKNFTIGEVKRYRADLFSRNTESRSAAGIEIAISAAKAKAIEYMRQILVLRGSFEAREVNPQASVKVRNEGERLARLILNISDVSLDTGGKIIKYQYGGWALLMTARVLNSEELRIEKSEDAIGQLQRAIELMVTAKELHSSGHAEAARVYEWVSSVASDDLNRTYYLLAIAKAVLARAGGSLSREEAEKTLERVSPEYTVKYPPTNNEDLKWALT